MKAETIKLIVDLTLARLDIIKIKHGNQGYDWAHLGKDGQKLIDETLNEIDEILIKLRNESAQVG